MIKFTENLLWIHQEQWQKELMCKYRNCISLIDATNKTTRYDLPLFYVCVRTNVGYCAVAEFITQSETASSIGEALDILIQVGTLQLSCVTIQRQIFQL